MSTGNVCKHCSCRCHERGNQGYVVYEQGVFSSLQPPFGSNNSQISWFKCSFMNWIQAERVSIFLPHLSHVFLIELLLVTQQMEPAKQAKVMQAFQRQSAQMEMTVRHFLTLPLIQILLFFVWRRLMQMPITLTIDSKYKKQALRRFYLTSWLEAEAPEVCTHEKNVKIK